MVLLRGGAGGSDRVAPGLLKADIRVDQFKTLEIVTSCTSILYFPAHFVQDDGSLPSRRLIAHAAVSFADCYVPIIVGMIIWNRVSWCCDLEFRILVDCYGLAGSLYLYSMHIWR